MRKLFTLLLTVAAGIGTVFAWDYERVQIGDLYYNLDATNQTAEVTSQNSSNPYWSTTITTAIIPASVEYNSVTYTVTSIGDYAFYGCSGLTSVTIPNSVTSIGNGAFYNCSVLTSIEIPNSVTSIGEGAFFECSGLTSPVFNAHVFAFMPTSYSGAYTIPDGIESIAGGAFTGCTGLTAVTIPNSVTSIGGWAFAGCSAFFGCSGLTSVTIGNSVTSIGDYAFYNCSGLTSIEIPKSVTSIGNLAFCNCRSLTAVTIEADTPPTIGMYCFYSVDDNFDNFSPLNISIYVVPCNTLEAYKTTWPEYASRITYAPLAYKISTQAENGSVDITSLGNYTTCDKESYYRLTVVPDYGYHFTQWSDGLKDNPRVAQITQDTTFTAEFAYDRVGTCGKDLALVWSYDPTNKVLTIGNAGEFTENMRFGVEAPTEMRELVVGNNVTAIGAGAFAGIKTLSKVSVGDAVKTIGEQAFYDCTGLTHIICYRERPSVAYSNTFDGIDKFDCTLHVLSASVDMYKAATGWRDFYYIETIDAATTTLSSDDVTVEPGVNTATVSWPTQDNAATYTIQITKDGEVFCTLIFNANGQLTGIAFAPSRDGQAHAPAATKTANGLQFTVTGLSSNTQYGYSVTAKDTSDDTIVSYTGEFTTTGETQGIEEISSSLQGGDRGRLILRNGQIFILRGDKTYTLTGTEVK